jgi:hemoglobin
MLASAWVWKRYQGEWFMVRLSLAGIGLVIGACALAGCKCGSCDSSADKSPMGATTTAGKSLYDRLGGEPAVRAVVDDFVGRAATNPAVNFTRKGTVREWEPTAQNVEHLKMGLRDFICVAARGGCQYKGADMKTAHRGMKITDMEFNALAADLKASLDKFKVPAREQSELLAAVEGTRKDIVAGPSGY